MKFSYQARDSAGKMCSGALVADGLNEASQQLRKEGKTIVDLHEDRGAFQQNSAARGKKKVGRDDVIYFATQLSVMVDTGVPISDALDSISQQTDNAGLQKVVQAVCEDVKGGVEFSAALERHPKIFGKLFVALMRASEASGTMGTMLARLSEYLEQERDIRKKIKGAMTYPFFMLSFCVIVVVLLLVFILPRFEKIYASKAATLPGPTRILLGISNGLVNYWPMVLVAVAGLAVGGFFYCRTPAGMMLLDLIRIKMPILGPMYRRACLARSLRTMATMVSTGVGMLEGLDITAQVAGNVYYSKVWKQVADGVKEGSMLSDQLANCPLMPRTVTQMISAGERTGKLGPVMNRVAAFCENDLAVSVKTVTNLIEPAMIMIMGLLVGSVALALLMPIFSISKVVAR